MRLVDEVVDGVVQAGRLAAGDHVHDDLVDLGVGDDSTPATPIGSPIRTTWPRRLRDGRGRRTPSFITATACTIEPSAFVLAIAIASATMLPCWGR